MLPEHEQRISLKTACKDARLQNDGKPANLPKLYRWISHGAVARSGKRVKLESVHTPFGLQTTAEAIGRFLAALDDDGTTPKPFVLTAVDKLAAARLDAIGI